MNPIVSISALALAAGLTPTASAQLASMGAGQNGFGAPAPLLTIGETLSGTSGALNATTAGDYTPVGVLDGLGAFALDADTVRVLANHELGQNRGYAYEVSDGLGGTFSLVGARVSYFDIDRATRQIVDAGLAYDTIYTADGSVAADLSFLLDGFGGFSRFCSAQLVEAGRYGLEDTLFFTGEEDGGSFNPVGGGEWVLDAANGDLWQLPWLGRGAWENVTLLDTGDADTIAVALSDDTSPFDADGDGQDEAAPLYLYIGHKQAGGDLLARNGLRDGQLYVLVLDGDLLTPLDFRGTGATASGSWVAVDNSPSPALADEFGVNGYDEYGFPTQRNLWAQAEALGTFGFSRPEDVATNPVRGNEFVLASTGVDTFAVDGVSGNGVDTFGTLYSVRTDFDTLSATVRIIYDGDADPTRALRSPDNLDWADDGLLYVQEDKAETDTLSGDEFLFGAQAVNQAEAGVVVVDPSTGVTQRVLDIDRSIVLDGSIVDPTGAVDTDAGDVGAWETSGILDVSSLFGEAAGTLFLLDVQAHGIDDQEGFNPGSRISDGDLVEGGQLLLLSALPGQALVDLGFALDGSAGAPALTAAGSLGPNSALTVTLADTLPGSLTTLVIGFSSIQVPFKGGVFVPEADLLIGGLVSDAAGQLVIDTTFPAGAPSGLDLFLQAWLVDAGAVQGLAASNALQGSTP